MIIYHLLYCDYSPCTTHICTVQSMSDINQQITKCLTFIKGRVTDVGSVADKLCEKGVLKMSERESIVGIKSPREQIQGILDIVTKREKGDVFIAVLNETQNEHVAKEITSMEITIGKII